MGRYFSDLGAHAFIDTIPTVVANQFLLHFYLKIKNKQKFLDLRLNGKHSVVAHLSIFLM